MNCIVCGVKFTDIPCCCDYATADDGTHLDGICLNCCAPNHSRFQPQDGVKGFERSE